MGWIISILIGALAGWLAGKIMNSSHGLLMNIIVGWVGSILGNFVANLVKISADGLIGNIILSVAGACLVLFIYGKIKK
ncbi:MAG: GlsB/YeaQ/YmgE family stress response membrane protein [Anaerolineaceae bacterium]|nr:GlsB/YeaQ/YmgE family stress response membrane protein [Anaerolineaceae bacterium]